MKLTPEQFESFKDCKSTADIIAAGSKQGLSISEDQAKQYLESVDFTELDENDIDVAGGCFTSTRACRMCGKDISHSPYYRHRGTGHEYCCSCAANSQMVGDPEYEYNAND